MPQTLRRSGIFIDLYNDLFGTYYWIGRVNNIHKIPSYPNLTFNSLANNTNQTKYVIGKTMNIIDQNQGGNDN
ncbi:hypothetical protein XSR1_100093 [Xenorhabdus szentirmaii DSM 16338]|uniref:Uncharacterized protein n=1 Tax=Xenorhabdus szentirmaii DSM 16338 TaxID=1427518 RepID=W1IT98_9GAMM|nr:hypothetical protein XSR1_100093 [Xenorhabdus szentirmaii DSM 16338]